MPPCGDCRRRFERMRKNLTCYFFQILWAPFIDHDLWSKIPIFSWRTEFFDDASACPVVRSSLAIRKTEPSRKAGLRSFMLFLRFSRRHHGHLHDDCRRWMGFGIGRCDNTAGFCADGHRFSCWFCGHFKTPLSILNDVVLSLRSKKFKFSQIFDLEWSSVQSLCGAYTEPRSCPYDLLIIWVVAIYDPCLSGSYIAGYVPRPSGWVQ